MTSAKPDTTPHVVEPPPVNATAFAALNLAALSVNKVRYAVQGYTKPKPEEFTDPAPAIDRAIGIVDGWTRALGAGDNPWDGQSVIEMGPGSDLSVGLVMLARGAKSYRGLDVNNLVGQNDGGHHRRLAAHADSVFGTGSLLSDATEPMLRSEPGLLQHLVDPHGRWTDVETDSIDIVTGNASFEHVPNAWTFAADVSRLARPGARLVTEIDLQTHTGFLRDRDPLGIYRVSDPLYRALQFSGIPNRVRPSGWKSAFRSAGWIGIELTPVTLVGQAYVRAARPALNSKFKASDDLDWLAFLLTATLD